MDWETIDTIDSIKNCLMHRIMNGEKKFEHHRDQKSTIRILFENTLNFGESNSALLIGPRGTGKTTLVNQILKELQTKDSFEENVAIVKLHGLVHTNDRISLMAIAQQMKLDNVMEDKVFGTFAENLTYLLECLKSGTKKSSTPVIFILDEFDLFCAHKNQTLLYNLFDIAQSAQAPICVLGITCHLEVIALFEKRVKSRFSHRQIYMNFSNESLKCSGDFNEYVRLAKSLLTLPSTTQADEVELKYIKNMSKTNVNKWNQSIQKVFNLSAVQDLMEYLYFDANVSRLRNYLCLLLCNVSESHAKLTEEDFQRTSNSFQQDDKVFLMQGLSVLEVCLIVAMKQETEISDGKPFNYKMIHQRYIKFSRISDIQSVSNPVIIKAFEHLKNLEIIIPANKLKSIENKEFCMYYFTMTAKQVLEGIKSYVGLPTEIGQWVSTIAAK